MADGGSINISGLIAMIVFYILILVIGLLAAWYKTRRGQRRTQDSSATVMVADRDIGLCVGIFTMTATWVGGGYINGTAEQVFTRGVVWAQAPLGYAVSLLIGAFFFAGPMRSQKYLTMLDPFQNKYGKRMGGLLYLPALCGELFWTAAILNALGSAVSVILNLKFTISVIASACVAVAYTFFGGLYSVAYTDVVQLICIVLGLLPCIPYSLRNEHVNITFNSTASNVYVVYNETSVVAADFWGTVDNSQIATFVDDYLLLIFGGIPWQVYFQRVLSAQSARKAQLLSFFAALTSICCGVIAATIGFIARFTDWNAVGYPQAYSDPQTVLPGLVQHVTTPIVSFIGLGAVSAAVMSSSDSSILAASSMFSYNVYKMIFRQQATDTETVWVVRFGIVFCGAVACAIGIFAKSVYSLWYLSADLVYVLLFPQLCLVIYVAWINSYGVVSGFLSGLVFRILLGESAFNLPSVIHFGIQFPAKSTAMLINLFVTIIVSATMHILFVNLKAIPLRFDFFKAFQDHVPVKKIDWQQLWTTNMSRDVGHRMSKDEVDTFHYHTNTWKTEPATDV